VFDDVSHLSRLVDDIDAVIIAAPPAVHGELAIAALELGLDVLVEKPLALNLAEATSVVDLADELGRVVMVDHTFLHSDLTAIARDLLRSGAVGKVRRVTSRRLAPGRRRTDVDALWNLAPHDVALILDLAGGAAIGYEGVPSFLTGVENAVEYRGRMLLDNGVLGQFHVSCNSPERVRDLSLEGETGSIDVDYATRTIAVTSGDSQISWQGEEREPLASMFDTFLDRVAHRSTPENHTAVEVVRALESLTNTDDLTNKIPASVSCIGGGDRMF
jgi:predicted dehydrogenase